MGKKHPLLITFEGGEGAGKSTLIEHLVNRFEKLDYAVAKTREPGGTLLGEQVRNLLLHQDKYPIGSISEILLFLTSRAQQIKEIIKPHLDSGHIVLCDRYNDSTVAYQGIARGVGKKLTQDLCSLACNYLEPDLTFVLDLDPKEGLKRTKKMDKDWDRLESLDLSFHEQVRAAYQQLAKEQPQRIVLIDASQPAEAVINQCWQAIERRLLIQA
ncbi:MAG: Thymidylate kinase [Chlamydiae bacterium]|nr:Thymidylate kinase [Chlamydiota bacterium]